MIFLGIMFFLMLGNIVLMFIGTDVKDVVINGFVATHLLIVILESLRRMEL